MIHIIDRYYLDLADDGRGCELIEKYVGKTKKGEDKEASRSLGYFSDFSSALSACAKSIAAEKIKEKDVCELNKAIEIYRDSFDAMTEILEEIGV